MHGTAARLGLHKHLLLSSTGPPQCGPLSKKFKAWLHMEYSWKISTNCISSLKRLFLALVFTCCGESLERTDGKLSDSHQRELSRGQCIFTVLAGSRKNIRRSQRTSGTACIRSGRDESTWLALGWMVECQEDYCRSKYFKRPALYGYSSLRCCTSSVLNGKMKKFFS